MRKLAILALCCLPLAVPAQTKVRLGGVSVSAGYSRSPFVFPYYYYPYFWDPWYYPGAFWHGFAYAPDRGEVKLTAEPAAEVYIDGAYAGTADKLKRIWLQPGAYTLSVQARGKPPAERRVYVLTGKTLKVKL
jgi:hypothetical protein